MKELGGCLSFLLADHDLGVQVEVDDNDERLFRRVEKGVLNVLVNHI